MATAWHNGFWVDDTTQAFNLNHRITRYGDGCFETILVMNNQPAWAELHYKRLTKSALLLGLILPADFSFSSFQSTIIQLSEKHTAPYQRVRIVVYRNGSGTYLPTSNYAGVFITSQAHAFETECKQLANVGIYETIAKPMNALSALKSSNALLYVLASIFAKENSFDDAILLNAAGRVCEATSSNLFVIKDEKIFTPSLAEGCVEGVLRTLLLNHFKMEEMQITVEHLATADSAFLSNTIQGVRAVQAINAKTYAVKPVEVIHQQYLQLLSSHIGKPFS
jgi:branched-subunit amino acid aminotransferase/4-amino-4-deoxychorismate lyase